MNDDGQQRYSKGSLTLRYATALSLVALLSLSGYLSLRSIVKTQEDSAPVINVSGRQRMLSQRVALFAFQYAVAQNAVDRQRAQVQLKAAADLMRDSHRRLILGDPDAGLPGIQSEVVRSMLFSPPLAVDQQVQDYLDRVTKLLAAPPVRLNGANPDLRYILDVAPNRLLVSLNAMVDQYEQESRDGIQIIEYVERIIVLTTLMTLLLEALFIFRPMIRAVVNENQKLLRSRERLAEAKRETDDILSSVEQGFFLLNRPRSEESPPVMGSQYSRQLERILECRNFAGISLLDALQSEAPLTEERRSSMASFLKLLFRRDIRDETLATLNPFREFHFLSNLRGMRTLQFQFRRIYRDSEIRSVMVSVQDITREIEISRELDISRAAGQNQMERLFQVLQIDSGPLNLFMENFDRELARMSELLAENVNDLNQDGLRKKLRELFRSAHTIKGEASLLQLKFIEHEVHALEDQIETALTRRSDSDAPGLSGRDFIPMITAIQSLTAQRQELRSLVDRLLEFHSGRSNRGDWNPEPGRSENNAWLDDLLPGVRDTASSLGKRLRIDLDNFSPRHVPAALQPVLREVLIQLLRNAISHGIESPAERSRRGKDPEGVIRISSQRSGSPGPDGEDEALLLTVRDDGGGLPIERIRERARSEALDEAERSEIERWPVQRVIEKIFHAGFSTRSKPDGLGGRGVGMDLVRSRIHDHGGEISVRSEPGHYTAFDVEIPLSKTGEAARRSETMN
ncbi:MAG: ATP-binding protein [bacterium]|nr:ATP-binding protein [bacterium]